MTPQQTREAVEAGGLTFRKQTDVSPYHYAAIFGRA
jgi:hypothetical protein